MVYPDLRGFNLDDCVRNPPQVFCESHPDHYN